MTDVFLRTKTPPLSTASFYSTHQIFSRQSIVVVLRSCIFSARYVKARNMQFWLQTFLSTDTLGKLKQLTLTIGKCYATWWQTQSMRCSTATLQLCLHVYKSISKHWNIHILIFSKCHLRDATKEGIFFPSIHFLSTVFLSLPPCRLQGPLHISL